MLVCFGNFYFYKNLSIRYLWYIEIIFPLVFLEHDKKKVYYHLEKCTIHMGQTVFSVYRKYL